MTHTKPIALVPAPREVRIPLTPATAVNLTALNAAVSAASQRFDDHIRSLLTQHGIVQGRATQITDSAPYELVVAVEQMLEEG